MIEILCFCYFVTPPRNRGINYDGIKIIPERTRIEQPKVEQMQFETQRASVNRLESPKRNQNKYD